MILIHGAPGARMAFVNAFLTNILQPNVYDVGAELKSPFCKLHFHDNDRVKNFNGSKIYIKLSNELLFLHLFLFLEKNLFVQEPTFATFHYSHRNLFDKLYYFSKMCFNDEASTDLSLYNYIVPFDKTYDINFLISLYKEINGDYPSNGLLDSVNSTNQRNYPCIPKNHAARVAAEVFNFEYQNGYTEEDRLWAINSLAPFDHESGICLDVDNFFDNICSKLTKDNYK